MLPPREFSAGAGLILAVDRDGAAEHIPAKIHNL